MQLHTQQQAVYSPNYIARVIHYFDSIEVNNSRPMTVVAEFGDKVVTVDGRTDPMAIASIRIAGITAHQCDARHAIEVAAKEFGIREFDTYAPDRYEGGWCFQWMDRI